MEKMILHFSKDSSLQRHCRSKSLKLLIIIGIALLTLTSALWGQEIEWIRQFGALRPADDWIRGVDTDASGNVYVAGVARGAFPGYTHAGEEDAYICKYDANGSAIWTRQFGTPSRDYIYGLSVNASDVYVVGSTNGGLPGQFNLGDEDAFVRKYDENGNEVWTRQFGSSEGDIAYTVFVDVTGIYVGGLSWGALPGQTDFGSYDAFVRKYDANGNEVWTSQFGSTYHDGVLSITVDATGIYASGYTDGTLPGQANSVGSDAFVRKYDASGNEIWTRQFGTPSQHALARSISVNATGIYLSVDAGYEVFIFKYDVNGNLVWTRQFGGSGLIRGYAISTDATGVYVAGSIEGALPGQTSSGFVDAFVKKYEANGNEVWTRQFGAVSEYSMEEAWGISIDANGIYVVGQTSATLPGQVFSGVGFIRKYDANGIEYWTRQFGSLGPAQDAVRAVDANGNVYVAGEAGGFLPGQSNVEEGGVFVRKYSASGNELWTRQYRTSSNERILAMAVDATGAYVAGYLDGALPGQIHNGGPDAFVRKYDVNGAELWTRQFGTSDEDQVDAIFVDGSGVYLAGRTVGVFPGQISAGDVDSFVRKCDADGNELWTRQFGTSSTEKTRGIAVDATGVYVAGTTEGAFPGQTGGIGYDDTPFVRKYDMNGKELWTHQFGTPPWEHTTVDISVDATGVYLVGDTGGALPGQTNVGRWDAFVRKYDANGNEVWTRQFGTTEFDHAYAVSVDATGVHVAGITSGAFPGQNNVGGYDTFVRTYDANGNELWTRQLGTSLDEEATGIAADPNGVYVVGNTQGDFNAPSSAVNWNIDAYVVKIGYNQPTPQEEIQSLIEQVQALNKPQGNGLINGKLKMAIKNLDNNEPDKAIKKLQDFIDQVNVFIRNGTFTVAEGQPLIDAANAIIAALSALSKNTSPGLLDFANNSSPTEFQLEQNTPNPFNPVTTIQFSVPRPSQVTLKVYNLVGQVVATLVDQMLAPGKHRINWDASHLASGVYIYRLETEGFAQTKRLVLMK